MNKKGFSLIEVNMVCVIVALLSAIAGPHLSGYKQSLYLNQEIRTLYGHLQNAKMEAIKANTYVVFQITPGGYVLFVDDGSGGGNRGDWVRQHGVRILVNHKYQNGVSLSRTTFPAARTRFNGRIGITAGRVVLENTKGSRTQLVANIIGRLRVEKV